VSGGRSDEAALMGVALAAIVTLVLAPGPFGWLSSVVGLTLLLILAAYDPIWHREVEANRLPTHRTSLRLRYQTYVKHLAFSAVYLLCLFIPLASC